MTAGDCCILREVTGGEADNSGTLDNYNWDTEVHRDAGSFTLFSDLGIQCHDAGPYLVAYNTSHTAAGTNRSELRSFISIGGVPTTYGGTSDFSRRDSDGFVQSSGAMAIVETPSANTILSISHFRADSNTGSGTLARAAGEMGFAVVKLDDAWSYLRAQDNTLQAVATSAGTLPPFTFSDLNWTSLQLRVEDRKDAGFTHSTTVNPEQVTLAGNRRYLVCYSVEFQNTSTSTRRNGVVRCQVAGATVPGSVSTAYARGQNTTQLPISTTAFILDSTAANQVLELQAAVDSESAGEALNVLNVALSILDLSEVGECIGVKPTADFTADTAPSTFDPIDWGTAHLSAGTNYSWNGANPSRIATSQAGRHLVWSSFCTQRTAANGVRKRPQVGFRYHNGTTDVALPYGVGNEYNRGDQSTTSAWIAAGIGGGVYDLASPAYLEVGGSCAATTTNATLDWLADYSAAFAIELEALRPPPIDLTLDVAVFELAAPEVQLLFVVALDAAVFDTSSPPQLSVLYAPAVTPRLLDFAQVNLYSRTGVTLNRALPAGPPAAAELGAVDVQVDRAVPLEGAALELTPVDVQVRVAVGVQLDPAALELAAPALAGVVVAPNGLAVALDVAVFELAAPALAGVAVQPAVAVALEVATLELAAPDLAARVPLALDAAVFELAPAELEVGLVVALEVAVFELAAPSLAPVVPLQVLLEAAVLELAAVDVVRATEGLVQFEFQVGAAAGLELAARSADVATLAAVATTQPAAAAVHASVSRGLPVAAAAGATLPVRVD